jgi:hypothetical protein
MLAIAYGIVTPSPLRDLELVETSLDKVLLDAVRRAGHMVGDCGALDLVREVASCA